MENHTATQRTGSRRGFKRWIAPVASLSIAALALAGVALPHLAGWKSDAGHMAYAGSTPVPVPGTAVDGATMYFSTGVCASANVNLAAVWPNSDQPFLDDGMVFQYSTDGGATWKSVSSVNTLAGVHADGITGGTLTDATATVYDNGTADASGALTNPDFVVTSANSPLEVMTRVYWPYDTSGTSPSGTITLPVIGSITDCTLPGSPSPMPDTVQPPNNGLLVSTTPDGCSGGVAVSGVCNDVVMGDGIPGAWDDATLSTPAVSSSASPSPSSSPSDSSTGTPSSNPSSNPSSSASPGTSSTATPAPSVSPAVKPQPSPVADPVAPSPSSTSSGKSSSGKSGSATPKATTDASATGSSSQTSTKGKPNVNGSSSTASPATVSSTAFRNTPVSNPVYSSATPTSSGSFQSAMTQTGTSVALLLLAAVFTATGVVLIVKNRRAVTA